MKRIWLIKTGEPVPGDGEHLRPGRIWLLSETLARAGHDVTWWNSTVYHQKKQQRYDTDQMVPVRDNLRIAFLHAPLYKRSVSLARITHQNRTARAFAELSERQERPDLILCCLPTMELCWEALQYGRRHRVPVIVDVRDLWPDAYLKFAPAPLRPLWRLALTPLFRQARKIFSTADAVVGVSEKFLEWGLSYAGRERRPGDRVFPFGYPENPPDVTALEEADAAWDAAGIGRDKTEFVGCFFGFLGRHFDIESIIEAARRLQGRDSAYKFVICGSGDNLERYRQLAADCDSVLFPGWVGAAEIWSLMRRSAVGLGPYRESPTLSRNLPNKPIEYLSAGLPVVSSLAGVTADLLAEHECGITYPPGDVEALVATLSELSVDRERLERMSRNAGTLFRERFEAGKVYGEMSEYLVEMSESAKSGER